MVHYPTIDGNHVIIDYSEVKATEEEHEFTLRIAFDGEHTYVRTRKGAIAEPDDMAQELEASLKLCGVKCERVGKTKVRVLGIDSGGKFYPVVEGTVKSKSLNQDQLPKITSPLKS